MTGLLRIRGPSDGRRTIRTRHGGALPATGRVHATRSPYGTAGPVVGLCGGAGRWRSRARRPQRRPTTIKLVGCLEGRDRHDPAAAWFWKPVTPPPSRSGWLKRVFVSVVTWGWATPTEVDTMAFTGGHPRGNGGASSEKAREAPHETVPGIIAMTRGFFDQHPDGVHHRSDSPPRTVLSCSQTGCGDWRLLLATNAEVAALFEELARLIRIADGSPQSFRARAYEAAVKTLEGLPVRVEDLSATELRRIPGIGKSSASKIREYVGTGRIARLDRLREEFPPAFQELIRVPGLGPKRAVQLRTALGVDSVERLMAALDSESVRELPGFGPKTEENLRRAVDRLGWSGKERRTPILDAMRQAERLLSEIRRLPGVEEAAYCGSLRRFRDTVADLDILVATSDPAPVRDRLVEMGWIRQVIGAGDTKTSVLTHSGFQVDVRMVPAVQWGAAILYFTGSKEHNIRLRRLAIERDWVLSEYALYEASSGAVVAQEDREGDLRGAGPHLDTADHPGGPRGDRGGSSGEAARSGHRRGSPRRPPRSHRHVGRRRRLPRGDAGCSSGPRSGIRGHHRSRRESGDQRGGAIRDAGPAPAHRRSPGTISGDENSSWGRTQHRAGRPPGLRPRVPDGL